ncbi:matrix-remodeling-associated protein 7-like [Elysia marginata]|uniref:Matrix-remodeling-associated protein 7-like n=1 Tax=Elysia marginata TaxID=1093978 RepID=A0AAV4H2H6_9GAST|nr:matrix-remodeling-associated protein 7-like [Elysia marginata]
MEFRNILNVFEVPNIGIYAIATIVTVLTLAISTRFILKFVLNKNRLSEIEQQTDLDVDLDLKQVEDELSKVEKLHSSQGNDANEDAGGDDEMEGIDSDDLPALSPRYPDPVDYCEHIQGEIKRVQQKVATKSIAETLTEDQLREEKEIQRQQLADIFRLMQEQQDRFGIGTMDDMQEQMKLYAV